MRLAAAVVHAEVCRQAMLEWQVKPAVLLSLPAMGKRMLLVNPLARSCAWRPTGVLANIARRPKEGKGLVLCCRV